jgi:hypothetical protein
MKTCIEFLRMPPTGENFSTTDDLCLYTTVAGSGSFKTGSLAGSVTGSELIDGAVRPWTESLIAEDIPGGKEAYFSMLLQFSLNQ